MPVSRRVQPQFRLTPPEIRSAIDPFFFFFFSLIFELPLPTPSSPHPLSPLVRTTNLHSLSRPCRKGITDIGSSNDGGETRDKEEERSKARRLRRQGSTLSISLNRGSADGNLYRKSLIRNRVDGPGNPTGIYIYIYISPLSLPQFIPSILFPSPIFFPLSSSSLHPLPPNSIPRDSTAKLYTRVTTTLHGERSIEGTTLPSFLPNFVSSPSRTSSVLSRLFGSIGENRGIPSYFSLPSPPLI